MPDIEAHVSQGRVVTMRDLSQNTSGVIAEIMASKEPAFLTKRGQFIAAIVPLEPGVVERQVIAGLLEQLHGVDGAPAATSDEIAAISGVNLDVYRSND